MDKNIDNMSTELDNFIKSVKNSYADQYLQINYKYVEIIYQYI